tara:strand:- start:539 stop:1060 length:522 start_codon:yes stop_codon:yes gene_type:complete
MSFKYGKNPFGTTKNRHSIFYPDNLYETVKNKLDVCFFHPNAKINEMVHTNTEMTYIYSVNGIYVTHGDVVYQITYNDDEIKNVSVELEDGNVLKGSLDYSRENKASKITQIPYDGVSLQLTKHTYTFSKSSDVTLVVLCERENLNDIYFELKDNIEHPFIKQHISSLLSCIN